MQMVLGFAHLGRMVKFIPAPVMAGFQNAAGFIVLYSQLHLLFGLEVKPAPAEWPNTGRRPARRSPPGAPDRLNDWRV